MELFSRHTPAIAHILAFLLIVISPLASYFFEGPFLRRITNSSQKLRFYAYILISQWTVTAVAVCILGADSLFFAPSASGPGLPAYGRILFAIPLAAFFVLGLMPVFQSLRGEKYRAAYARAYLRTLDDVSKLLPETLEERLWFAAVSITAGVCEEFLCRGFMFRYLGTIALHLPLSAVLLVAAASFGLNHIYQGKTGVVKTTIAGLAFGGLFLLTGNLLLPMILHAAVDMQAVFILRGPEAGKDSSQQGSPEPE